MNDLFAVSIASITLTAAVAAFLAIAPRQSERNECARKNNVFECVRIAVPKATADTVAAMEAMAGLMGGSR